VSVWRGWEAGITGFPFFITGLAEKYFSDSAGLYRLISILWRVAEKISNGRNMAG
jgi:hypothetical protein